MSIYRFADCETVCFIIHVGLLETHIYDHSFQFFTHIFTLPVSHKVAFFSYPYALTSCKLVLVNLFSTCRNSMSSNNQSCRLPFLCLLTPEGSMFPPPIYIFVVYTHLTCKFHSNMAHPFLPIHIRVQEMNCS